MKMKFTLLIIGLFSLFLSSCNNDEGEGGTSVVQGYIYKVYHDDDIYSFKTDTFPAAKTDVYIIYGNEPTFGDKIETSYDGFYQFKYLTKGSYKVFAYSTYTNTQKVAVIDSVTVGTGNTKTVNDIYIHEGKALNTSFIKGTVNAKYFNKGIAVAGYLPAYGERVYIRAVGSPYQFDEVRTGLDGVFMFQNLSVGEYEVFVFSESTSTEALSPVTKTVTITEKGVIETISDVFYININV